MMVGLAGILLVCVICAIYRIESRSWRIWWRPDDEGPQLSPLIQTRPDACSHETAEPAAVDVAGPPVQSFQGRAYSRDVFKYTIRRPRVAVRRKAPDLGGYSEVSIRLYDQVGNRLTVHQKVRLN